MLTKSQKRYLFAIYRLGQNGRPVKSTEVASVLRDKGKHCQDDSEAYRRGLYNQRALP